MEEDLLPYRHSDGGLQRDGIVFVDPKRYEICLIQVETIM